MPAIGGAALTGRMIPLNLNEIAAIVRGTVAGDAAVTVAAPAVLDGRRAEPGGLFVAFAGASADGHAYAEQAGRAGAVAVLGSRATALPTVVVEDAQAALQALAGHVVARLRGGRGAVAAKGGVADRALTVAALTGSQGKTSTKDLLAAVLASRAPTIATIGSQNNELGVPLTMLRADASTRFLVLEMGARHVGQIAELTALVAPDIGVVLNVGQAHISKFGSREAIAQAKGELVQGLAPGGTAVLNADDPRVAAMRSLTDGRVLTFGRAPSADVRVLDLTQDPRGRPTFTLRTADASARVALPVVGAHLALNAAAAAAAGLAADVPLDAAAQALTTASLTKGRMELRDLPNGATLLDDSYNANPDSTRAALTPSRRSTPSAASRCSARCWSWATRARRSIAASGRTPPRAPMWWWRSAMRGGLSLTARGRKQSRGRWSWRWRTTTRRWIGCGPRSRPGMWCWSRLRGVGGLMRWHRRWDRANQTYLAHAPLPCPAAATDGELKASASSAGRYPCRASRARTPPPAMISRTRSGSTGTVPEICVV